MGIEQEVAPQNTKSRIIFHLNLQIIAYLCTQNILMEWLQTHIGSTS